MGEAFTVEKELFCSGNWMVSIAGAPCAGRDSSEMTLKYWDKLCRASWTMLRSVWIFFLKKKKKKPVFKHVKNLIFFFFSGTLTSMCKTDRKRAA